MADKDNERLVEAIGAHGDQLGGNLVHLKRFLERLQREQHAFLAEQRAASDKAQRVANWTAIWAAIAATAAAVAAIVQSLNAV